MTIPFLTLLMEADSHRKLTLTGSMTSVQCHTNKAITDFLRLQNRKTGTFITFVQFNIFHKSYLHQLPYRFLRNL